MSDNIIAINASLIKKFFHKGDVVEICPKKIYECSILRLWDDTTESMQKGSYFETHAIGGGVEGKQVLDLPRKKLSKTQEEENRLAEIQGFSLPHIGAKLTDQIRIDEQIAVFKQECQGRKLNIIQQGQGRNVQLTIYKKITIDGQVILIKGTLDIFPARMLVGDEMRLAIIDLKLTKDLTSTFGDFCWGKPEYMDHIQPHMYHELVRDIDFSINPHLKECFSNEDLMDLQDENFFFVYWVFDYKASPANMLNPIVTYDKNKKAELYESIRKTNALIEFYNREGWTTAPMASHCKGCPVRTCTERNEIQIL